VVWVGETMVEARPVTTPTLLFMLRDVAPLTVQVRVVDEPAVMVEGVAARAVMAGIDTEAGFTLTVTCAVEVPVLLVALRI